MDESPLERSIREETDRAISAVRQKEALEIARLEEACAADIDGFRGRTATETDSRLESELSRLENREALERKKRGLGILDAFINRIVDEAMKEMRTDPRYARFLRGELRGAAERINASAEVCLNKEDLGLAREILHELRAQACRADMVIKEDGKIKWGGCVVHDTDKGRIYNSTMERILFRKYPRIRREVVRIIRERTWTA